MGSFARLALRAMWLAIIAIVVGVLVLLGYSVSEVLANPGISLEDGYWIGREPWISTGVDLTVVGATAVALSGTLATFASRPRFGLIALIPLAVVGFFWLIASIAPQHAVPCDPCQSTAADPFSYAYSLPGGTIVLLLLPALVIAVIAFATRPRVDETTAVPAA